MQFLSLVKELLRPAAIQTSIISDTLTKTEWQNSPKSLLNFKCLHNMKKKKTGKYTKAKKRLFWQNFIPALPQKMAANRS